MNILVVYYTRTGTTKTLAKSIAKELGADIDIDEIIDEKKRKGIIRYILAGRDARNQATTQIRFQQNPDDYDLIILGTPIWAGNLPPAPRTYLNQHVLQDKKVGFFITSAGSDQSSVFNQLKQLTPKANHLATLGLTTKEVKAKDYDNQVKIFVEKLN